MTANPNGTCDYMMGGIPINFPFPSAYPSQKQVMAKVITALSKKQNAILESPTGSGKSMAILCSVLAWHKKTYHTKSKIKIGDIPNKPINEMDYKTNTNTMNHRTALLQQLDKFKSNQSNQPNLNSPNHPHVIQRSPKPQKIPKLIFTTRTHGQLQQLIAEYKRTNYFHDYQMVILGSRKSLCINTQIRPLHDRNDQCKKALENHDCHFYRNRGYGQQFKSKPKFDVGQVFDIEDLVTEGKRTSLCPYFGTHAILETADVIFCPYNYILDPVIRDQMSIDIKSSILIIDEAHNVESVCRDALTKKYTVNELQLAIDELVKLRNCKTALPSDIIESVEEIKGLIQCVKSWVDELVEVLNTADYTNHRNVFPRRQLPSQAMAINNGEAGINDINKISDIFKKYFNYNKLNRIQFIEHARNLFKYFEELRKESNDPQPPTPNNNKFTSTPVTPSKRTANFVARTLNKRVLVIIEYLCMVILPRVLEFENDFHICVLPKDEWSAKERKKIRMNYLHFWCLSPHVAFKDVGENCHSVILTSGTLSPIDAMAYELKVDFPVKLVADHVIDKTQVMVTTIEKGINGNKLRNNYSNLQQTAFKNDIGSSLLHLMRSIPEGVVVFFPSYATMQSLTDQWIQNGTYEQMQAIKRIYMEPRGSDEHATNDFMQAIEKFGRDCGNKKYIEKYKRTDEYKKMLKEHKRKQKEMEKKKNDKNKILKYLPSKKDYSFQPPTNGNNNDDEQDIDLINGLEINIKCEKGAAFFGVCRGKISEGIDFSDGMSRAVILIGIPYPNQKDIQIHFKKKYNDRETQIRKANYVQLQQQQQTRSKQPVYLDGNQWYALQAFRALNQALGRCIRHRFDFGCIIFLEARFCGKGNYAKKLQLQLSKWVRPCIRSCYNVNHAVTTFIKPYFDYMEKTPPSYNKNKEKWKGPFPMPQNMWSNNSHYSTQQQSLSSSFTYNNNNKVNNNRFNSVRNSSFTQASKSNSNSPLKNNNNRFNMNNRNNSSFQTANSNSNSNRNNSSYTQAVNSSGNSPITNNRNNSSFTQITTSRNNANNNNDNNNNGYNSPRNNNNNDRKFQFRNNRNNSNNYNYQNSPRSNSNANTTPTIPPLPPVSYTPPSTGTPQTPYDNNMSDNNHNKRKRKFNELQTSDNDNFNDNNNKRLKCNDYHESTELNKENERWLDENWCQCVCGAKICTGKFKSVSLPQSGGSAFSFYASEQEFPCDTADNCIWSSKLGLCFMYKKCESCKNSVGFHVVAASTIDRLRYVKNILFLKTTVKLLKVPSIQNL